MTWKSDLKRLSDLLRQRQAAIAEAQGHAREELRGLKEQERDPEYEEGAQTELADYTLSLLIENARRELILIAAALERIEDGGYGECIDCGEDIAIGRLSAIPFAVRCEDDARLYEDLHRVGRELIPSL